MTLQMITNICLLISLVANVVSLVILNRRIDGHHNWLLLHGKALEELFPLITRIENGTGIPSMAEDTKVAE